MMANMSKDRRRQYGSGSVSQRKSDGKWVGAIMAGWTPAGTRRRITVVAATEAECKRKLERKKGELARTGPTAVGMARATVKSWAEQWLTHVQGDVRPKTWSGYQSAVNKSINPTIGHRRLDQLTTGDIRALEAKVISNGNTTTTARHAHAVLRLLLRAAVLEGHTVPPAVFLVKAPEKAIHDRDAIPRPDALAILKAARELTSESRWIAAFLQGLRQGECLGLRWEAIDLPNRRLDISWQLQAIPYEHGCGEAVKRKRPCGRRFGGDCPTRTRRIPDGYEVRPLDGALCLVRPKTAHGQRIIPLVPWMHAALLDWQQKAPVSPHGLVWPRPDGRPELADNDRDTWHRLQDTAQVACVDGTEGRRYLLHEIRHTTATLLLEEGIDPETVKAILGHSSIITSRNYQHVSTELAERALDAVAARLQLG
jgi:integrase